MVRSRELTQEWRLVSLDVTIEFGLLLKLSNWMARKLLECDLDQWGFDKKYIRERLLISDFMCMSSCFNSGDLFFASVILAPETLSNKLICFMSYEQFKLLPMQS